MCDDCINAPYLMELDRPAHDRIVRKRKRKKRARARAYVGQPCHYCEVPSRSRDHIVPRYYGGQSVDYNMVPACLECNLQKANSWPSCGCDVCDNARRMFLVYRRPFLDDALYKRSKYYV